MDVRVLVVSAARRNAIRVLTAALFVLAGFAVRIVSAEELRTHPSQYSDPRCESRRVGPHLDRDELRCDPRFQPRRANSPTTPTQSSFPPPRAPSPVQMSPPSRGIERDVGFDDAFVTLGNTQQTVGAAGANPGGAAGTGAAGVGAGSVGAVGVGAGGVGVGAGGIGGAGSNHGRH
jgi:hypothetical protein